MCCVDESWSVYARNDSGTVGDPLRRDRDMHNQQTRETWAAAVKLLMNDQNGHWPLTARARLSLEPTWVTTPEEVNPLLGQIDYIAPWGFADRKRDKPTAAKLGNLLW